MRTAVLALLSLTLAACDTAGGDTDTIVRYAGAEITEADAAIEDIPGRFRGWSGTEASIRMSKSVLLTRTTLCGDECSETTTLRFEGDGELPDAIEATIAVSELLPERLEERQVLIERVEIQDWGPEVYSGIVYPAPQEGASTAPIVFWANDLPLVVD